MSRSPQQAVHFGWAGVAVAIAVTLILASIVVYIAPGGAHPAAAVKGGPEAPAAPLGLSGTLTAGGVTVTTTIDTLSFTLDPGQTLDSRLPSGPLEGDFSVAFSSGSIRRARMGAEIQGGRLMIRRGDTVLLSEYAGQVPRRVMSEEILMYFAPNVFSYRFVGDGKGRSGLTALWQPEGSPEPLLLPVTGTVSQ